MSFYLNYTFKTSGGNLTGVADFTAAAVGTVFEKKSGELFTKNTQGLFEKTARVVPSLADLNAAVTGHETNTIYHKQNMSTTIDPSVTSDSSVGYSIGSIWINTSTNTAFTCTDVTVGAAQWTSGYVPTAAVASIPLSQKGAAGGVATLDSGGNLLKGLKAYNGKNVMLATNTDLGALPLATSSGFYDVQYTAAGTVASRRGLPLGWYHLEIQRHSGDVSGNRFYTVRASALNIVTTGDIWTLNVQAGVVTNFTKQTAAVEALIQGSKYSALTTSLSLTKNINYTNTSNNIVQVNVALAVTTATSFYHVDCYVDNIIVATYYSQNGFNSSWVYNNQGTFIVPPGSIYSVNDRGSTNGNVTAVATW